MPMDDGGGVMMMMMTGKGTAKPAQHVFNFFRFKNYLFYRLKNQKCFCDSKKQVVWEHNVLTYVDVETINFLDSK